MFFSFFSYKITVIFFKIFSFSKFISLLSFFCHNETYTHTNTYIRHKNAFVYILLLFTISTSFLLIAVVVVVITISIFVYRTIRNKASEQVFYSAVSFCRYMYVCVFMYVFKCMCIIELSAFFFCCKFFGKFVSVFLFCTKFSYTNFSKVYGFFSDFRLIHVVGCCMTVVSCNFRLYFYTHTRLHAATLQQ